MNETNTEAELIVYNPKDFPKGINGKQQISFEMAKVFYQNLTNKKEFDQFYITFISQKGAFSQTQRFDYTQKQLK